MIKKSFLIIIFMLSTLITVEAQSLLYKISLEDQVNVSTLIVEGEVVSKEAYFSTVNDHIYTINKIKVFRAFKGNLQEYINVVTRGGSIDLKREEVKPNIQLDIGDLGVFMLENDTNEFNDLKNELNNYHTYSNLQGFYRYDKYKNTVTNPYYSFSGIQTSFYDRIKAITTINTELLDYDFPFERQSKSLAITANIASFSPNEVRAGIGEPITILGTDFGNEIGNVIFENADSGGLTNREAFDSAIESWSDSQIVVNVPSFAGTGRIQVVTSDGDFVESVDDLTVLSSELNAEFSTIPEFDFRTKLFNSDNQGGYTWTYNEDFFTNVPAVESFERAIDEWVCATGISWLIDEEQSNILGTFDDGFNIVSFINGTESNFDEIDPGILAVTSTYYLGCQDGDEVISYVDEVDMTFNSDFDWFFGIDASDITLFQNDFQGTATHELGHAHNLGHVISPANLMHFETSSGPESATREIDNNSEIGASLNFAFSKTTDFCLPRFIVDRKCGDDSKIAIESAASIENPVNDNLLVRIRDLEAFSYSLHIYSLNGSEEFFSKLTSSDVSVDVSFLSRGIYIAKIVVDSEIYIKRILKL